MTTPTTDTHESIRCSFCFKSKSDVERLIAGAGAYICNECVDLSATILAQTTRGSAIPAPTRERHKADPEIEGRLRDHLSRELTALANQHQLGATVAEAVEISGLGDAIWIDITTHHPGVIIGRGGATLDKIRNELTALTDRPVHVNIRSATPPPS